jgi:hypothetical protein
MLLQCMELEPGPGEDQSIETMLMQTVQANYKGYTKKGVTESKGGRKLTGFDWESKHRGLQGNGKQQRDCQLPCHRGQYN